MTEGHNDFYKRLGGLNKKHAAITQGYTTHMRNDGLIVVTPRRAPTHRRGSIWKNLIIFAVGMFLFKAFILASLGQTSYDERIARLNDGTSLEQAGAWIMQVDPATRLVADMVAPYLP